MQNGFKRYMIVRKHDNTQYLPEVKGGGRTWAEFVSFGPDKPNPMLFKTAKSAEAFLRQWVRGKQYRVTKGQAIPINSGATGNLKDLVPVIADETKIVCIKDPVRKKRDCLVIECFMLWGAWE